MNVMNVIIFKSIFSRLRIYESDLHFTNSLKPKTMERRKKCEKEQMSNECNSRLDQIQLSCLNSLLISAGMFPSGQSLSCSTLHQRYRNPFQREVLTVLSAAPERERKVTHGLQAQGCSALNGAMEPFSSEWAAINLLHPMCSDKVDFHQWRRLQGFLRVLFNMLP